jgi:hypothetical protein
LLASFGLESVEIVTSNLDKDIIFEDKTISRDWYIKSSKRINEHKDPPVCGENVTAAKLRDLV